MNTTKIRLIVASVALLTLSGCQTASTPENQPATSSETTSAALKNCDTTDQTNIKESDPAYNSNLDKDSDGLACEGKPTVAELSNAQRSATSYLEISGFSRQGLIDQLSSEYGDQYPIEEATQAVDSLNIDYNAQARRSAESYLELSGFSCQGLIDQLSSEYGDQYTIEQATYGAQQAGAC